MRMQRRTRWPTWLFEKQGKAMICRSIGTVPFSEIRGKEEAKRVGRVSRPKFMEY